MGKCIIVYGEQCQSKAGRMPAYDERGWAEFDPRSPDYEHIEVSLESLAFFRSQRSTYARRVESLLERELGLTEQVHIEDILREAGSRFHGADTSAAAREWLSLDFDASGVDEWVEIGVWDPETAETLRDAGLSPADVQAGAEALIEGVDDDFCRRLYTDADPVYSTCNGDTPIDVLIGAAMAVRTGD